jgi:hypothetical protein
MAVYFVQAGGPTGFIKIGFAEHVESRLRKLRPDCPLAIELLLAVAGDRRRERELHEQFRDLHVRHEWHRPAEPLLQFVREHGGDEFPADLSPSQKSLLVTMARRGYQCDWTSERGCNTFVTTAGSLKRRGYIEFLNPGWRVTEQGLRQAHLHSIAQPADEATA